MPSERLPGLPFDAKEGEDKENKRAGARKAVQVFRIVTERGQLGHSQAAQAEDMIC